MHRLVQNAEQRIFVEYDAIYVAKRLRLARRVLGIKVICIQSLHKISKVTYTTVHACKVLCRIPCQRQYLARCAGQALDDQGWSSGRIITDMSEFPVLSAERHPRSRSVDANDARFLFSLQPIIAC